MRNAFFFCLFFIINLYAAQKQGKAHVFIPASSIGIIIADTLGPTVDPANDAHPKVIIGNSDNQLEIFPLSSLNDGLLIRPINRAVNKGLPTAFYLTDTASWSFYTNSKRRLSITGVGNIMSTVPLLINTANQDNTSQLRVNGQARIDTSLYIQASADSLSFISLTRKVKSVYDGEDDGISPYTSTPTAWAMAFGDNLPVFRIRHPNNVSSGIGNTSTLRDFLILPYQYGFAIEFDGVVECWVGEWSIHRNDYYKDTEGNGDGYGAVMWVGNDQDVGGVRFTARNNSHIGGNVIYGEMSVEKFGLGDVSNGDLRLRLPSTENKFQFVYGGRGSKNIVASLGNQGFVLPKISSVSQAVLPQIAQVVYDSTASQFKGYNGTGWVNLGNEMQTGSYSRFATGTDGTYAVPHGLGTIPSYYTIIATSPAAGNINYVTADAGHLYVCYTTAPPADSVLSWNWQIKP